METYVDDNNGNLSQITDRRGQETSISYDVLNRPETVAIDAGNRLTQLVDSFNGTISEV